MLFLFNFSSYLVRFTLNLSGSPIAFKLLKAKKFEYLDYCQDIQYVRIFINFQSHRFCGL